MRVHHLFGAACALGIAACSSCQERPAPSNAAPSATASASAVTSASTPSVTPIRERRSRAGNGGPVFAILTAARDVTKAPEQRAKIDEAEKPLLVDETSARDERKAFVAHLSAGIKAGKLDRAALDGDLASLDKVGNERHEKEAAALDATYAALDPAQRSAVVANVRERDAERAKRMRERGARFDAGAPDGGPGTRLAMRDARLERIERELGLSAEQKKKLEAAAPKIKARPGASDEASTRPEALLAAFEKDGFEAKKVAWQDRSNEKAAAEEELALVSALLPILEPAQRETLAARIERGGSERGRGPHGLLHRAPANMWGGDADPDDEERAP